jgi:hypothetical protein
MSSTLSPWVPVIISALLGITGLGAQAVLVAFFLGKLRSQQDGQRDLFNAYTASQKTLSETQSAATAQLLAAFTEQFKLAIQGFQNRLGDFESWNDKHRVNAAEIDVRLGAVERNTESGRQQAENLIRLQTMFDAFVATWTKADERTQRDLQSLQRQMANVATGAGDRIVELPTAAPKSRRRAPLSD